MVYLLLVLLYSLLHYCKYLNKTYKFEDLKIKWLLNICSFSICYFWILVVEVYTIMIIHTKPN